MAEEDQAGHGQHPLPGTHQMFRAACRVLGEVRASLAKDVMAISNSGGGTIFVGLAEPIPVRRPRTPNPSASRYRRIGDEPRVHDKKVMSHAALGSDLRSQKS